MLWDDTRLRPRPNGPGREVGSAVFRLPETANASVTVMSARTVECRPPPARNTPTRCAGQELSGGAVAGCPPGWTGGVTATCDTSVPALRHPGAPAELSKPAASP